MVLPRLHLLTWWAPYGKPPKTNIGPQNEPPWALEEDFPQTLNVWSIYSVWLLLEVNVVK